MTTDSPQPAGKSNGGKANGIFAAPQRDFMASIVVFLVALPLCMGIAIASGVPVAAGLITGIVGGLIVGWISGQPLQVSGPAAGLTVIVYDLVREHGLEVLGVAVLIGGVIQLIAGLLRYGRWFRAVSPAVIHGMLAGIGVLIFSSQFHVMVDDSPKENGVMNLITIPEAIQKGLPMPEMTPIEDRASKRELLQQFGQLHEQQVQLRESAAERIPATPHPDDVDLAPDAGVMPDIDYEKRLQPLAERQAKLLERLEELQQKVQEEGVAATVRDPEELERVSGLSSENMEQALADLREADIFEIRFSQAKSEQSLERLLGELKNHQWAAKVGMLTLFVLIGWTLFMPRRLKLIPAPLVAVIVAMGLATYMKLPVLYVEVPDNLWSEIHFPTLTLLSSMPLGVVIQGGIVLAVVASAETLLCATAVDKIQTEAKTNYDKELTGQGVGNIICGLLGALPMTGVIVRSSANVNAGGKTRLSAILHGLWLLIFVSFLAFVLRAIPTSALAAILVYTGYKLVNVKAIKNLVEFGWGEVAIYFVTVITIVVEDLLVGVLLGVALSAAKLLYNFSQLVIDLDVNEERQEAYMTMKGAATFIRLPLLAEKLEQVPGDVELHVDIEQLSQIDHACLDLIMSWAKQHEDIGGRLVIDWDTLHSNFHSSPYKSVEESSRQNHDKSNRTNQAEKSTV